MTFDPDADMFGQLMLTDLHDSGPHPLTSAALSVSHDRFLYLHATLRPADVGALWEMDVWAFDEEILARVGPRVTIVGTTAIMAVAHDPRAALDVLLDHARDTEGWSL